MEINKPNLICFDRAALFLYVLHLMHQGGKQDFRISQNRLTPWLRIPMCEDLMNDGLLAWFKMIEPVNE